MFKQIKDKLYLAVSNLYLNDVSFKKNTFSFLLCRLMIIVLGLVLYVEALFSLNVFFKIQIGRQLMVMYIALIEIAVLILSSKHYEINKYEDENTTVNHCVRVLLFGLKNLAYNIYLILPFLLAYGFFRQANLPFYINSILYIFLLPLSSVLLLLVIPNKNKYAHSRFLNFITNITANIVTFLIYVIVFYIFRINLYPSFPVFSSQYTSFTNFYQLLELPISLNTLLQIDVANLISVNLTLITKHLINTLVISGLIFAITSLYVSFFFGIIKQKFSILKSEKDKPLSIRNNNIKVFRINFIIKSCMPRSPTY